MKSLDIRDIAIIDAFPVYDCQRKVLNVGCGGARIDYHLADMGYRVCATDVASIGYAESPANLSFYRSDIFDLSSFPIKSSPIVICSEVLEHLSSYKLALVNLIALTEVRLVITVPYKRSFFSPDHINFWSDKVSGEFKNIYEFIDLCVPYSTAISKVRTKHQDVGNTYDYLIVVDKRQNR